MQEIYNKIKSKIKKKRIVVDERYKKKKKKIVIDDPFKLNIYNYIMNLSDSSKYEYSRTPSSKLGNVDSEREEEEKK